MPKPRKPTTTTPQVQFTVLENGLDFIVNALTHLRADPSHHKLKYAILHISAGLELLLKDRLRREHWTLVFADVNKADRKTYSQGDFVSVDLASSLRRLESICGLSIEGGHKRAIFDLKVKRNRLEHFATVDSTTAIKALAAEVLSFAVDFVSSQFPSSDLLENESALLDQLRPLLSEFNEFVSQRLKAIHQNLSNSQSPVMECPACLQETMLIDDGVTCLFCGYTAAGDDAAQHYVESLFGIDWKYVADGGVIPVYRCPECWAESLVDVGHLKQDLTGYRMVCFACGQAWGWDDIDFCANCGNPFPTARNSSTVCYECFPRHVHGLTA